VTNYYDGLLKLCGFEDDDFAREKPRIEEAFCRLALSSEDILRAESWVQEQHDVELMGLRKILRAWILELFDLVLAKDEGKKVIYYGYPSIQGPGMAIRVASDQDLWVGCPDIVFCHTLGHIFNKLTPVLEAAEARGLPPGHSMCSLQQIRNGALALGMIPVPDLVTGSSYYCDMGSKADELLHEIYGHRAIYVDGSMDSRWGEFPEFHTERVKFLGAQLNKLFTTVEAELGIKVTRESWDNAMATSRHFAEAAGKLGQLMCADPPPVSAVVSGLVGNLAAASTGRSISEGPQAVSLLCQEVEERVEKGTGIMEKDAPRVMIYMTHFSDPSVTHMIENAGLAPSGTPATARPERYDQPTDYENLGEQIAWRELSYGFAHSAFAIVKVIEGGVRVLGVDGVIWCYTFNCRPMATRSHLVKQWVEKNTGVPVLALEMDFYESRSYSAATLRTRVEAFAEMLRSRKAMV